MVFFQIQSFHGLLLMLLLSLRKEINVITCLCFLLIKLECVSFPSLCLIENQQDNDFLQYLQKSWFEATCSMDQDAFKRFRLSWFQVEPRNLLYKNSSVTMCERSVAYSCLTLWDPMDCSLPGSSVHGTLQTRTLEWVAMPSSRGSSQCRDRTHISQVKMEKRLIIGCQRLGGKGRYSQMQF